MAKADLGGSRLSSVAWLSLIMGGLILLSFFKDIFGYGLLHSEEISLIESVLRLDVNTDSWLPMYLAALERIEYPEFGLYQTIFFEDHVKFQYPPSSLLPFLVMIGLDLSWAEILMVADIVSFVSMIGICWCVYRTAIVISLFYNGNENVSIALKVALFLVLMVGTFTFYPIIRAQYLGQIQVLLDFLVSLAFLMWLENKKFFSGTMIALAALVKPQFGLLLVWGLLRKEKEFSAGMFIILAIAAIPSLIIFGFQEHLDYLAVLSYIGKHGEVFWANQSINGILNRLLSEVSSLEWSFNSYAPYNWIVYVGTLSTTIVFLLFGLLYRPSWVRAGLTNNNPIESVLDMATMTILLTIASPVAWEHHYGVVWPIIVILMITVFSLIKTVRHQALLGCLALVSVSYLLTSNFFYFIEEIEYSEAPMNLLQSYIFYGGLILLAAVLILRNLIKPSSANEGA